MTDRIHPHQLRHATRYDNCLPAMFNGIYGTVREGFRLDQPGILEAQQAATAALFWLRQVTINANRERAK